MKKITFKHLTCGVEVQFWTGISFLKQNPSPYIIFYQTNMTPSTLPTPEASTATFWTFASFSFQDFCHNSKFMHVYVCPFNIYEFAAVDAHEAEAVYMCCSMCVTLFMVSNVRQFIYQMHMYVRKLTWPSMWRHRWIFLCVYEWGNVCGSSGFYLWMCTADVYPCKQKFICE